MSNDGMKTAAELRLENQELRRRIAGLERDAAGREGSISAIAENAGEWIWEVDTAGLFIYAGPLAQEVLGYRPDEVVGKRHFYDFFHPDDRDSLKAAAFAVFARREPFKGFINRNLARGGRTVWLSTSGVPVFDGAGSFTGYRGLNIDITELVETREAFLESEERYKRIAENVQYLIYRMSLPDGRYEYVSPAALEITGYAPEQFYADPGLIRRLIHPAWSDYFARAWEQLLQGEMPPSYEYQIVDSCGKERWLHQRNVLIRDGAGRPLAIEGIVSDITDRKRAEEALRESEAGVRRKLKAILEPGSDIAALKLPDIIDTEQIRAMLEDFFRITAIPSALIDISGEVLVAVGWQDICSKFHRVHPEARRNCLESDTRHFGELEPGEFTFYRCKNGLWDAASPVMFGGRHVGSIFIGQFFLEDAGPDYDLFREQARKYGFDEQAYLAALEKVPRYGREELSTVMSFLGKLSEMVAALSYGNVRLARSITEKDQLLNDLRASEERFRSYVENANDIIYSLTPGGVYSYVSPNWTNALGHEVNEIVGKAFMPLVHPEDAPACQEFLAQVLSTGKSQRDCECRVRHKDGTWRWYSSNASLLLTPGQEAACMAIGRDITERKRIEDALLFLMQSGNPASGEDFFQSLARYLAENLGMDLVWVSRLQPDGLSARTLAVYKDGHFDENFEYLLKDTLCAELVEKVLCCYPKDIRRLFPQDQILAALMAESYVGATLWSTQGLPIGLIAVVSRQPMADTHLAESIMKLSAVRASGELERRDMEEALHREQALTEAILDSAPGIIYLYDDQSRLVRWNKKHEEMTGYSAGELYGKGVMDWYTGDEKSQAAVLEGLARTIEHGFGDAEGDLQRKDGTKIPMYFTACPLVFDGKTYFVGIGIDIAERRRDEAEKDKLQTQLLQAQKMEAVGQLAGGIAHDFNNLLQVILGNMDFLQTDQPSSASWQDELEEVRKAAERAAELTCQLLAFSRRQIMKPLRLDLNLLVQGVLRMLSRVIGEHIEICFLPGSGIGAIYADKGQIEQVLMNLCVNARDAMPRGGRLTIKTEKSFLDADYCHDHPWASEGPYALVRVRDTGEGMDAMTRAHLFEPFFTTKEIGHGTGLGLATVYGIIKQHNGLINVQSEPGLGSEFSVFLPVVESQTKTDRETEPAPVVGGTETILVAEDEPAVLKLIEQILYTAGYTILPARDGQEALQVFREHAENIDLVILDVMMPGLSGREVMDQIRPEYPHTPLLFSSGYSESAIHTDFVIEDGLRLIQKPYRRDSLLREVRQVLDSADRSKKGTEKEP